MTPAVSLIIVAAILAFLFGKERADEEADERRAERRDAERLVDWGRVADFPYSPVFSDREVARILEGIDAL